MDLAFHSSTTKFTVWLRQAETHPGITEFLEYSLRQRTFPPPGQGTHRDPLLLAAIQEQTQIGWDNLLFGRIGLALVAFQETYLQTRQSRRSIHRWAASLVHQLLLVSHTQWITRNGVLHERDAQGLLLAEGQSLQSALSEAFSLPPSRLLAEDRHLLLDRSLIQLQNASPSDKYAWLGAFRLAQEQASKARASENHQLHNRMASWLAHGSCTRPDDESDDEHEHDNLQDP